MNTATVSENSLKAHPAITTALGLAPLVIKAETLLSAALMALSFSSVLVLSLLSVSMFKRLIPHDYRLLFILLISSSWVTVIDLILQTYFYEIRMSLDIYVPLIAMNSLLLWMLDGISLMRSLKLNIVPALSTCMLVIIICVITGAVREMLTQGLLLSDIGLVLPELSMSVADPMAPAWRLPIMYTSAGALIILGCVVAGMNFVLSKIYESDTPSNQD
jgi:electron transport complex protein RnfE